ncbi:MAG: ribosome small subunit-dependent GTPase A, partial [Gemmatimonadetes bacterium]|nr:ribosome small subunit-dependent GTPase A [Gemmatimonadota bacterium]
MIDSLPLRRRGIVRKAAGGVYDVELDGGDVVSATLRGRLKLEQRTGERVVPGDRVEVELRTGGATIEMVEQRHSQLVRRAPGFRVGRAKVLVANVDQMVAVFAAARPEPRLRMLDRFLVLAEANDLPALIVVNKTDLVSADDVRARFAPYHDAGYGLLYTSVPRGVGIEALRERLCGRVSVFTGPSGAGKSSLLNALEPSLQLRTADLSEAVVKGRHTTVTAELLPLRCGGHVADTPGLRELGLWGVPLDELDFCFPEFRPYLGACRFGGSCTHVPEPGCAV